MPPKSAPMTQAAIHRMIKESVDAAIATERARQPNVRNDASGSGLVRGRDTAPVVRECTFAGFMKCNPAAFRGVEGAIQRMEHELRNLKIKEYDIVAYTQRFNELALMCLRMVEPERVKVDAYIRGLTDNIKGEVTSSKPANLNKAIWYTPVLTCYIGRPTHGELIARVIYSSNNNSLDMSANYTLEFPIWCESLVRRPKAISEHHLQIMKSAPCDSRESAVSHIRRAHLTQSRKNKTQLHTTVTSFHWR
ncbi:hypothetical protein Tco_1337784 [Tanacetum coccineum]